MAHSPPSGRPRARVLSGIRPTGPLHVGHLVGALANWVRLQDEYECFFMIADWHALTTEYSDPSRMREWTLENVACALAAGVSTEKVTLFRQSDVPEHAELHLLLSMVTPVPWLERVPSYKEQREQLAEKDLSTYGFLGYPVLQTADILAYRAEVVPVGDDQVAHLELGREITRRFNHLYGPVFPEPQPLLTSTPRLPGPDRRKMSKSYGNAIELGMDESRMNSMIKTMFTDPKKIHRGDKGHPEECVVFAFQQTFNPSKLPQVEDTCRDGSRGCADCKKELGRLLWERIRPVYESRKAHLQDRARLDSILEQGARKARATAGATLGAARSAMKLA